MLAAAGALCVVLAVGHTVLGHVWVLHRLSSETLPPTPLGGARATAIALAVTWDVVTIVVLALGVLLIGLAERHSSAERSLVAHTVAAAFVAMSATAIGLGRRHVPT